ncbi:alpha/beta fold hydrolase [Salipaludibacillus sp. CUR1]|uniref:alpha/beta hydrolase n=1 Tax=Salipaludibacillus sp. CUR1 TaxID=2820003 RepID=UPI001E4C6B2D|nr:alpha/beta hydrolase [Salipaludibacillus sp. CUR1]MCE7791984.1 alpha/beta fold hydrolase [Salipaludibacillus sp. CUR1]
MARVTSLFTFSDKVNIPYYEYPSKVKTDSVMLCIHGLTSEMEHLFTFAEKLSGKLDVDVHLPILRGYTSFETGVGDLPEKNKYDSDLKEMINELAQEYKHIYLMGHSIGAANVMRYFLEEPHYKVRSFFLVSPFLHPSLKVSRDQKEDNGGDDFYEVFYTRAVMLRMLDRFNIQVFSQKPVVKIPMREIPYEPDSATVPYTLSYRLITSRFITKPGILKNPDFSRFNVFIGNNDEVIDGLKFQDIWEKNTGGKVTLLEKEDHNRVLYSPLFLEEVGQTIKS